MTAKLNELAPIAKQLNERTNRINETIGDLNAKLAKLNLGIEAVDVAIHRSGWGTQLDENAGGTRTRDVYYLAYAKVEEKWQLCLQHATEMQYLDSVGRPALDHYGNPDSDESDEEWIPLLQATRSLRLKALEHVESLLSRLKQEAEKVLQVIDEADNVAREL